MTAPVFALTAFTVLLASGAVHVERHRHFRTAIGEHAVVPRASVPSVAIAVTTAEIGLGVSGLVAVALTGGAGARALALAAGGLMLSFAVYGSVLVQRGSRAYCGCAAADYPINVWVPVRAAALALAATWAAVAPGGDLVLTGPPSQVAFVVLATLTFSALLWTLPDALGDPLQLPFVRSALGLR